MFSRISFRKIALVTLVPFLAVSSPALAEKPAGEVGAVVAKSKKAKVRAKRDVSAPSEPAAGKPKGTETSEEASKVPAFHLVRSGPFQQTVKLSGMIESTGETPIEMNLKRWAEMSVIRAVPHGSAVKKGDVLIEVDSEALKKQIDELKAEMPLKRLDMAAVELELEKGEKSTPLALEKARREKMRSEEDLAYFEDHSRPMRDRAAKEEVKEAVESLAYAEEELKQLRKMYEQDDLTEETEEIVLRRAENTVARLRWSLEQTEARTTRILDTLLPREHEVLKADLELRAISWRSGERSMRGALEKLRLETSSKRRQLEELEKSLIEYEEDLAAMKVSAPRDGIVYYGMSQRGKWTTASVVEKKLIPGGKLSMREIVMTLVDPSKLQVRLLLSEDQLKDLAIDQKGTVKLKWKPDYTFDTRITSLLYVPYADKTFDGILSLEIPEEAPTPLPGMTVVSEIRVYEKQDALAIPKTAVEKIEGKEVVTIRGGKRIPVKTGKSNGEKIEILEGLKPGDVIELGSEKTGKGIEGSTEEKEPDGGAKPEATKGE